MQPERRVTWFGLAFGPGAAPSFWDGGPWPLERNSGYEACLNLTEKVVPAAVVVKALGLAMTSVLLVVSYAVAPTLANPR